MINITEKYNCCGCQVCGDVCPKSSIFFEKDEEGIWYPKVNPETCIDCHLCEKICPILNKKAREGNAITPEAYVFQAPSPLDRLRSASGGAYTLFVREVFKRGGYIAGHIWEDDYKAVKGFITCNPDDLEKLRGTKYLQSNVEGMYKAVKELLDNGEQVLFSGTPCQNAAMHSYLRKEYENLIMTDFVCMGIDSPFAFKRYIESLENHYHSKIVYFKAKSKEVGWRYLTNKAVFENGKSYFGINNRDANLQATFLYTLIRPSCYDCKFKGFPRYSDITIGDYWKKKLCKDNLDDNTGTSYAILHNQKAIDFFEQIKPYCNYRKIDSDGIVEGNKFAVSSVPKPCFSREDFYRRIIDEDFVELGREYYNKYKKMPTKFQRLKECLKNIVRYLIYYRTSPVSLLKNIYYNHFSGKISFDDDGILILRGFSFSLGTSSKIHVKGRCVLDGKHNKINVKIGHNGILNLDNNIIDEGVSIELEDNTTCNIGYKTRVDSGVQIHGGADISIGEFCYIQRDVEINNIMSELVYFDENEKKDCTNSIEIGTHVLLNRGVIINGGSMIGDEVIVKPYTVVNGEIPHRTVVEGKLSGEDKKSIIWKFNFENLWNYKN